MANNNILSYRQKCVDFGMRTNLFLLSKMDKKEVEKVVLEQIGILGGNPWLYKRINKNMKIGKFDPFFVREHCRLYSWRESFFDRYFPGTVDCISQVIVYTMSSIQIKIKLV